MITSANDRAFLRGQFREFSLRGLSDNELDSAIDAWFANDRYADNPAYAYDNESCDHA